MIRSATRRAAEALRSYQRPAYGSEQAPSSIESPVVLSRRLLWPGELFCQEARIHREQAVVDVCAAAGPLPSRLRRKVAEAIAPTEAEIRANARACGQLLISPEEVRKTRAWSVEDTIGPFEPPVN